MTLVTTATELPRLMRCIGSRLMPASLPPDHDHEARDEGNAAHWLSKEWFDGRIADPQPGIKAYNGYVITQEMIDHVGEYISRLEVGQMEIETTFGGEGWEVRGRADHICYLPGNTLIVDDFKYGWRLVEPEGNWTLIAHAIGWCIRNNTTPSNIVLRIHQPRPYHPNGPMREWRLSYVDLMSHYSAVAQRLANATDDLATSPMCTKCHALPTCPAARRASMNAIDAADLAFSDDLPDAVLTHELETLRYAKDMIESRETALTELITHKITTGHVVQGYALKQRLAQTKWATGITSDTIRSLTGKDCRKDGIVTPAQAKRLGVPDAVISALTVRPVIGVKLERIDANKEASKYFGGK